MRDNTGIHWNDTEGRIFDLLQKYPGVIISSHRLARAGMLKNPNTLHAHIRRMRAKLAGTHHTINDAPRVGYVYTTEEL